MRWEQLLSTKRHRESSVNKPYKNTDLRTEFEKDYHRIIGSASFRRLQDKTQVFPLDQSDFIRTRLTHSLEVSSIAKSLGQNIGENILRNIKDPTFTPQMKEDMCNILQCAGLIHDIGNPPFGHFGETAIRKWFQDNLPSIKYGGEIISNKLSPQMLSDFYNFEGNAQALRLITKLHFLVDDNGMNLTYALLNTIIKYPISSIDIDKNTGNIKDKKMGYYLAEQSIFEQIQKETGTNGNRHPLTYVLEAADDIAYNTADIEDAFVKGYLTYYQLREQLKVLVKEQEHFESSFDVLEILEKQYHIGKEMGVSKPEVYAIKNWIVRIQGYLISSATQGFTDNYDAIMAGEYKHDLFYETYAQGLVKLLGRIAYENVFSSKEIYMCEVKESNIINQLMNLFVGAVLNDEAENDALDKRILSFVSDNYITAYYNQAKDKSDSEKLYLKLLLITDYICGMTDSYIVRLYQEINGIKDLK